MSWMSFLNAAAVPFFVFAAIVFDVISEGDSIYMDTYSGQYRVSMSLIPFSLQIFSEVC